MADVEQLVFSKQEWLQKSVQKSLRGAGRNTEISTFYDGTAVYIWGKRYEICLYDHAGKESYQLIGDKLFCMLKEAFRNANGICWCMECSSRLWQLRENDCWINGRLKWVCCILRSMYSIGNPCGENALLTVRKSV